MQNHICLQDFHQCVVIGKGSYAKVVLVQRKDDPSGQVYAMKILKKKYIEKRKQELHVMTQRNILAGIDHPFIVKFHSSFQNEKKLFFVLEYCPGGELFGLLSKKHRLAEEHVKFYAAQMILALEYLHQKNIIYRDLKPQNVLIDQQGYLRLTDFGLSKMNIFDNTAFSVCGTPEYLAPEILFKQGHGKPVDWWCLGSLIYEMICGFPPFFSKSRAELFDRIKFSNPNIPSFVSSKVRNLLEGLFEKRADSRLGSANGAVELKSHPWFDNVNWQALVQKKIKAPFVPSVKNALDVSNFDPEFTECQVESFKDSLTEELRPYNGFSFDNNHEDMDLEAENPESGEIKLQIEEDNTMLEEEK